MGEFIEKQGKLWDKMDQDGSGILREKGKPDRFPPKRTRNGSRRSSLSSPNTSRR